jgi:hypothetical protein
MGLSVVTSWSAHRSLLTCRGCAETRTCSSKGRTCSTDEVAKMPDLARFRRDLNSDRWIQSPECSPLHHGTVRFPLAVNCTRSIACRRHSRSSSLHLSPCLAWATWIADTSSACYTTLVHTPTLMRLPLIIRNERARVTDSSHETSKASPKKCVSTEVCRGCMS